MKFNNLSFFGKLQTAHDLIISAQETDPEFLKLTEFEANQLAKIDFALSSLLSGYYDRMKKEF